MKPPLALAVKGSAGDDVVGISCQHGLGLSGGMTQAVELPGRKCRERDDRRRLIGPNGFSPDQAFGRERKNPAGDRRIGMVALDRFPADAQPVVRGCTELGGPVQCDESPDGRRLILKRADPPGRVDPSRVGTALETMGMSQEVECTAQRRAGRASRLASSRRSCHCVSSQRHGGTVRPRKVGEAPRLEAEQEREVGVQNGAWGVTCRLIHEAFLGSLHEVCPS